MKKIRKGFTLIEMVIVLFIISMLMLLMIPNLITQKNNAKEKSNEALVTTILTQAQMYKESNNTTDKIDLKKLEDDHYITKKQRKQALEAGFKEDDDLLTKNATDIIPEKVPNTGGQ